MRTNPAAWGLLVGLALTATTVFPAAAAVSDGRNPGLRDDWQRAAAPLRLAGIDVGRWVDEADLMRAKRELGVRVGGRIDGHDLDAIVAAARQRTASKLAKAGLAPEGDDVTDADLVRAKDALGVQVGGRIDPGDAQRILARAEQGPPPDPAPAPRPEPRPEPEAQPAAATGYRVAQGAQPVFATVGGVELRAPSAYVQLVGFHQAAGRNVLKLRPAPRSGMTTLPSRYRGTHRRSAADVAVPYGRAVLSPVTGRVVEVTHYSLYGRTPDVRIRIVPEQDPGLLVTVLHVRDPRVKVGTKVWAGHSMIAGTANLLPFSSQIDRFAGRLPHVHIEVRPR